MPNTTNFNWPTPADTDLVKDGAAAIRNLGNGIDTSLIDLKGGTTGQILSKASNADMDFTFITPNVGDITEVQAGTGISVASGTGPIPVVTNSMATEITAKGDLIVGTGSGTFDNLPVGTNGYTLVADSAETTGLKWAAPSSTPTYVGCSLADNTSQTLANNTFTALALDTEITDSDGFHSTVTNTSRITIPTGKGGKYLIYGVIGSIQSNATGLRFLRLYVNGAFADPQSRIAVDTEGRVQLSLTEIRSLSAGDYIQLFGMQDSGGNLNFEQVYFGATLLGA